MTLVGVGMTLVDVRTTLVGVGTTLVGAGMTATEAEIQPVIKLHHVAGGAPTTTGEVPALPDARRLVRITSRRFDWF